MICSDFLNMEDSRQKQIICSLETMWTEVNSHLKQFASFLPTKSSIQRTSSFSEETTNAQVLTESMDSMTSAKEDTISSYGKLSLIALTVFQLQLLLMKRSFVCMEVFPQSFQTWSKSEESWDPQMCQTQAFSVTYFGQIPKKTFKDGKKTIEESLSSLAQTLSAFFLRNMT